MNSKFHWKELQNHAFECIKKRLARPPILTHFQEDVQIKDYIDASYQGLGAVLVQPYKGEKHPVTFLSRRLSELKRDIIQMNWKN